MDERTQTHTDIYQFQSDQKSNLYKKKVPINFLTILKFPYLQDTPFDNCNEVGIYLTFGGDSYTQSSQIFFKYKSYYWYFSAVYRIFYRILQIYYIV